MENSNFIWRIKFIDKRECKLEVLIRSLNKYTYKERLADFKWGYKEYPYMVHAYVSNSINEDYRQCLLSKLYEGKTAE